MFQAPKPVVSAQTTVHDDLLALVKRHQHHHSQRPIAEHTQRAFDYALKWLSDWDRAVIIDACCGVGESTLHLAKRYPNARVIGIDKSEARLNKHQHYVSEITGDVKQKSSVHSKEQLSRELNNYLVLQADLNDFWRLLADFTEEHALKSSSNAQQGSMRKWYVAKQYILYPNPYPKKTQVGKRWHASAVFKDVMRVSSNIEVRSNWKVYVDEFQLAAAQYDAVMQVAELKLNDVKNAITPFERKYASAGQALWIGYTLGDG
ncbi:tRNA (guanine(46)-N(7))-methyltransferase TrmB [Glaciecola siphonariae]|uniref:tRNA (guanine(46)-N(7))-methyltransferase n=1 Tax=Glaciecola siphonariae TaxID=521012 RepID=A0ABV9LXL5_9ALTE